LDTYLVTFHKICSNADNIITEYGNDPVTFYGILFCYLSYHD
jgi:hypothetical protein